MKNYKIAVLAGDGIGPEITQEAIKVLKLIEERNDVSFELMPAAFGACAYFEFGDAFPQSTIDICDQADAILKGTIGLSHEESKKIPIDKQPERGALLPLRRRYNTYANFRPVSLPKALAHFSPLKPEIIGEGIDIIMVRELVGGLYFGHKEMGINEQGLRYVKETLEYDELQISRILHQAFKLARKRKKLLHNIHKSNVLKSSVLWNEILDEVAVGYPDVEVIHQLVDSAATNLCLKPTQFDVMVMENMFGDIGKNIANPYSMIGSVAMMLENSFDMAEEAKNVWAAMQGVFGDGYSTADLSKPGSGVVMINTVEFGDKVVEKLRQMPKV
ncbi:MAG: 3-isopropylmalate dehydrogenase [Methylococcaceae bacterium]|nr:3-isopropylmalate dehydrogenase [Methylococcaceae bacterium]OYV21785.1 MAG: 3-isopropylmalate dehydrogenase [Methylococcaceae bacterium NSO1]